MSIQKPRPEDKQPTEPVSNKQQTAIGASAGAVVGYAFGGPAGGAVGALLGGVLAKEERPAQGDHRENHIRR